MPNDWEVYLTEHERLILRGEFGEPRALSEWSLIRSRAESRMERAQMANAVTRFGDWVRWLTVTERSHLIQMADEEPQERWVEHYRAIALGRERVMRVGARALFGGVRGSVSRLCAVGVAPRVEPVEIDPVTGRPYGEIIWEPLRPRFERAQPVEYVPPREPRKPYPGYPVGQPSLPVAIRAPAEMKVVGTGWPVAGKRY